VETQQTACDQRLRLSRAPASIARFGHRSVVVASLPEIDSIRSDEIYEAVLRCDAARPRVGCEMAERLRFSDAVKRLAYDRLDSINDAKGHPPENPGWYNPLRVPVQHDLEQYLRVVRQPPGLIVAVAAFEHRQIQVLLDDLVERMLERAATIWSRYETAMNLSCFKLYGL
jgi:hypothetical protein